MHNIILRIPLPDADTNMDGPAHQQSTFPKIVNTLSLGTEIKSDPDWDYHQPAKLTGPRTSLYRKDTYGHVKPHCKKDVDDRGACVICRLCGKRGRDMYNMREHIEAVHPHLSPVYHCKLCAQEFKSHNCLKVHTKKYHWELINVVFSLSEPEDFVTSVEDMEVSWWSTEEGALEEGTLFDCTQCHKTCAPMLWIAFSGQYICPICNWPMIHKKVMSQVIQFTQFSPVINSFLYHLIPKCIFQLVELVQC